MMIIFLFLGPLNNEEPLHLQVLLTIYKIFTSTRFDCPRFGNHWDHIGFQVKILLYSILYLAIFVHN